MVQVDSFADETRDRAITCQMRPTIKAMPRHKQRLLQALPGQKPHLWFAKTKPLNG